MSKEQTPITAEDLKVMFAEETGITTYSFMGQEKYIEWLETKMLKQEQYAQAKVLEVLNDLQFNIKGLAHDEIYWLIETQVKPNYKL